MNHQMNNIFKCLRGDSIPEAVLSRKRVVIYNTIFTFLLLVGIMATIGVFLYYITQFF